MVQVDWGDYDETLLVFKAIGRWTLAEYRHAIQQVFKLMASSPHTVNVLVDLQNAANPPANIIPVAIRDLRDRPTNYGKLVVISRNPVWRKLWEISRRIHQIAGIEIHFVDSANDAYALVIPQDSAV